MTRRRRSRSSSEDVGYLDALARARGADAPDDPGRRTGAQRRPGGERRGELGPALLGRGVMTAIVSPVATARRPAIGSSVIVPGLVRGDLVLHLHRLDDADDRALLDGGARLDRDPQHVALDRRRERVAAVAAAAAPALRRGACGAAAGRRRRRRGARRSRPPGGPMTFTSKRLPETSTV